MNAKTDPNGNLITLVEESRALNPDLFSMIRMQLMSSLFELGDDGATIRELKAVLGLSDGALHSNLAALESMGYVVFGNVTVEDKNLKSCHITKDGEAAWTSVVEWLKRMLECRRE